MFYEEFICAILVLLLFQYINYNYLTLFSDAIIKGTTNDTYRIPTDDSVIEAGAYSIDEQIYHVVKSKEEYAYFDQINLILSSSLVFHFFLKLFFNAMAQQRSFLDKWAILDLTNGLFNLIAMFLIGSLDPLFYLHPANKDYYDYYMILVLCISWIRFFSYFLSIRNISKLILTLLAMVTDTLSFLFIMACFILIMASIFTTLYQDTNPDKYGNVGATIQTLFNAAMAVFDYDGMEGREISHSLLTIFTVFFANILLLNYLIAILSTTYEKMRESGVFRYKCNLYSYCERYMVAFNEPAYGGLLIYPPPLCYLSVIMVLFSWSETKMMRVQYYFAMTRFWFENCVLIFLFAIFEVCMFPLAFIKQWVNLFRNAKSWLKCILHCFFFLLVGIFINFGLICYDIYTFVYILKQYEGCRVGKIDELAEIDDDETVKI
eukprot:CAMPEP_0170550742 /NCGR_PEP_ID=MMETSP0211-20121228/8748_1 /TAXON_ID=311385 /ORGANISM="Pseudokeronopsis sp., Strain OXSARD2" /LENGTH=433 /DNA_ID=CAMNT_0010857443 /DNA_START=189 /DNA_END=1490 /DNA_ORIENTATION=-